MRIIPAIDILDGKCVRLSQGEYSSKIIYNQNPLEVAKAFEDAGISYLHIVDLDGAKTGKLVNIKSVTKICEETKLKVDFGGGIRTTEDIHNLFDAGVNQVTIGSLVSKNPKLFLEWLQLFGAQKIILGADCKNRQIAVQGWTELIGQDVVEFINGFYQKGVDFCICTDVSKDGMMLGPSFELYREIIEKTTVKLIASGGVSQMDDLIKLKELGCEGAIVGKAIYEGSIKLQDIAHFINLHN